MIRSALSSFSVTLALGVGAACVDGVQPAPAGLVGEWTVTSWTATRSRSNTFPGDDAGWSDDPRCAELAEGSLRSRSLRFEADGGVTVNERACTAELGVTPLQVHCPCGHVGAQVCSLSLTLRVDEEGRRLAGEERLGFSYTSPPYCDVRADVVARR